ncbi:MAG: GDSL-type esterase/lipase family protein, partial [Oscillospiraceae bacterium]|nr:GDSL-type esterase/lipase family protein [Oscillospiraceae bacterium]
VLTSQGVIDGFPDGTFDPNSELTSAQFIKMVCASVIPAWLDGISSEGYANWAEAYYYAALDNGLIRDGEFDIEKLNDPIRRYDASLLLSRALDFRLEAPLQVSSGIAVMIADNSDIPARYLHGVQLGYSEGLLTGYADKKFNGDNHLTRAEGATLIHRLIDDTKRVSLNEQVTPPEEPQPQNVLIDDPYLPLPLTDPETSPAPDTLPQQPVSGGKAAFIGNSLIHGLYLYGKDDKPDYYFSTGISIFKTLSSEFSTSYGTQTTLADALPGKDYSKIYLLFGINELDANTKRFRNAYSEVISQIKQYCPDSEICVISVLPVSKERNDGSAVFTQEHVKGFNDALKELCAENSCTYVDIYTLLADNDGYLPASSTWDGIHLNNGVYVTWADFLKS